jgi:hypothetical protein
MLTRQDATAGGRLDTSLVRYIKQLDQTSASIVDMADDLPMPLPLRSELQQTWRITRQKLAYFLRELERSDGEMQEELTTLHSALLPDVISYQVKLGAMMIGDTCADRNYLDRWNELWNNFSDSAMIERV